jgi:hypothetical protein
MAAAFSQPKIQASGGTTYDFGDAFTGTKVDRVLSVRNVGNDTLKITDVKAGCGCTAVLMTTKNIPPGDSGKLSITFDTHNYGGSKATKQVYVSSNDTTQPKLTITFSVNVVNILALEPKFFSFSDAKVDSTYTKTITITNPSKDAIRIISVNTNDTELKVDIMKKQLMPGEQTQLQVVFRPTKSGTPQPKIEIVTDNKIQPKFEVPVYAWVNRK